MSTLPRPIGRVAFLARFIIAIIAIPLLYVLFSWALWLTMGQGKENVPLVFLFFAMWLVAFLFLVMCFIRFVIIARLASIGMNRWYALLLLVPFVGLLFVLFLLFCPANYISHDCSAPKTK